MNQQYKINSNLSVDSTTLRAIVCRAASQSSMLYNNLQPSNQDVIDFNDTCDPSSECGWQILEHLPDHLFGSLQFIIDNTS